MNFDVASGVTLSRRFAGENDILLTLFLKGLGLVYVSAKGGASSRARFGGATEPLMWCAFSLYGQSGKRRLKCADIADDMLKLRSRRDALFASVGFAKLLKQRVIMEHPSDGLLSNLYWNMKLMDGRAAFPAAAAEWRFLWRWLRLWGLAPLWADFFSPLGIKPDREEILKITAHAKTAHLMSEAQKVGGFADVLSDLTPDFAKASQYAKTFLNEI
ncbi:hypothetical protein FACS1894187_10370 [Synergistales bacterium]|nr:hypothetical protein FACS1894187_10370 [Synergistales bacterium]